MRLLADVHRCCIIGSTARTSDPSEVQETEVCFAQLELLPLTSTLCTALLFARSTQRSQGRLLVPTRRHPRSPRSLIALPLTQHRSC